MSHHLACLRKTDVGGTRQISEWVICNYDMAQVLRYDLDSLGATLFESLVQTLLKSELGMGVEAWGGSGDHGRDAYCPGALNFPAKTVTSDGPFVFQAKFVAGANAAGARPFPSLKSAIRKEVLRIKDRQSARQWRNPKWYVVVTNAFVSPKQKAWIEDYIKTALRIPSVTTLHALDLTTLLDSNPGVVRSFPFVVSRVAIEQAVAAVVNNQTFQRSDGVLRAARELVPVFVVTGAYREAWKKLADHHFVVLEGPPEMGKTAIAWMIASFLVTHQWQVIDCAGPLDFFQLFNPELKQVFIADDAFGTTEYRVTLGDEWARELHKVLPKLDLHHRLIWTSRAHILKEALREMSLQGTAANFPKPGDVIVNAAKLNREEKAYILYRHARSAHLETAAKTIVKTHAAEIIDDDYFTPPTD